MKNSKVDHCESVSFFSLGQSSDWRVPQPRRDRGGFGGYCGGRFLCCLMCFKLCCCGWFTGCTRAPQPDMAMAEVEPDRADVPDMTAASRFLEASTASAAESLDTPNAWPQLFGPDRTSAVPAPQFNPMWGSEGPSELWSVDVGTGYGSPVVAANRVVFNHRLESEEIVQCVAAESGETLWEHRYPTSFQCDYEYSNGPYSTPLIHGDVVYALGAQGQLFCLNLATGQPKWSRDLHHDYELEDDLFAVGSTPGIIDDKLIVNIGATAHDAGIVAFNRHTGETVWEATDHGAAYCSPFFARIHDEPFVFVVTQIGLVSLHPDTGEMDWMIEHRCRAPMSYNSVSPLVYEDKVLVVTGPGPGALCVQVQPDRSFQQRWKNRRVIDCQYNTLMLSGKNVFGFTSAGQGGAQFRCVDLDTGELKWKYHSLLRRGQGLIAGNAIVLLGEQGHLASLLVDDESPQVLAFTAEPVMQAPCYCAPAFASGRLYLKDETRVACFNVQ